MKRIEEYMNRLTDMDWGWWPFLSLRPAKDAEISNSLLLKMAACYGSFYGLIFGVFESIVSRRFSIRELLLYVLTMSVFFFIGYKLTFAVFWNRRARRLTGGRSSHDA